MNTDTVYQTILHLFKKRRRRTLYLVAGLCLLFIVVRFFSTDYLVTVPVEGGTFSEAMVGYPRFINPVLAQSPTDKDIVQLVFSGLLTRDTNGQYIPDLAESIEIGENGTQYTISLDPTQVFHDGSPVTAEDILFTYELIQDPLMKSPLYSRLLQTQIEVVSDSVIVFKVPDTQSHFEENLTIGIMQKSQWQDVSIEEFAFAEENISPRGTGPYKIETTLRDSGQKITGFTLNAFRKNSRTPYINSIVLRFYPTQTTALQAFELGTVDNFGNISAQELLTLDRSLEKQNIQTQPLSRVFALFFNQDTNTALQDAQVRTVISQVISRQNIVDNVFFTRAQTADGPLPKNHKYYAPLEAPESLSPKQAQELLIKKGWELNGDGVLIKKTDTSSEILSFTLSVPDVAELVKSAQLISSILSQAGIEVLLEIVPEKDFTTQVIRKRNFESVLFGQIVENPEQLFGFWHSSGVEDPGVNIAGYKNTTVDAILERLITPNSDEEKVVQDYRSLQKQIRSDVPAVFLFTPYFIYASDEKIQQNNLTNVSFASDRFEYISDWYIKTESLLPFFTGRTH